MRYVIIFRYYIEKIQVSLISDKNNGYVTLRPVYVLCIYLAELFLG